MNGAEIKFIIPLFGGIPISETVVNSWIIMVFLMIFAYFATKKLEKIPSGVQNFVEAAVDLIYNFVRQMMGSDKMGFAPYIGTILIYYWFCNMIPLLGFRSPTTDLNTTLSFALITFVLIHVNSIKVRGIKHYFKEYLEPTPVMLPLHILGELAKPVSLSFRPFGNISGGVVMMSLLYGALEYLSVDVIKLPIPLLQAGIPVPIHLYLDVFSGTIQAFVFAILTMIFISMSMENSEQHE